MGSFPFITFTNKLACYPRLFCGGQVKLPLPAMLKQYRQYSKNRTTSQLLPTYINFKEKILNNNDDVIKGGGET